MGYLEIIMKKTKGPNLSATPSRQPKVNMKNVMNASLALLTKKTQNGK